MNLCKLNASLEYQQDMQFTIPFCYPRLVYGKRYLTIGTLTAPSLGNTTCEFQSVHTQITLTTSQETFLVKTKLTHKFPVMIFSTVQS